MMGRFATGVAVVATEGPHGPHGMTANSVTSVSLSPALLLFCASERARIAALVRKSRRFSVNILAREQEALSRHFAGQPILDRDFSWSFVQGVPTLAEAEVAFVCDLRGEHVAGDHSIFVGEVRVMRDCGEQRQPLIFYRGRYVSVSTSS